MIYNPSSQIIEQVYIRSQKPGIYSFIFSPDKLLKGIYFLRFKAEDYKVGEKTYTYVRRIKESIKYLIKPKLVFNKLSYLLLETNIENLLNS